MGIPVAVCVLGILGMVFALASVIVQRRSEAARGRSTFQQWGQRLRELEEILNSVLVAAHGGMVLSKNIVHVLEGYFPDNRLPALPTDAWSTASRLLKAEQILTAIVRGRNCGLFLLPTQLGHRVQQYIKAYPDSYIGLE